MIGHLDTAEIKPLSEFGQRLIDNTMETGMITLDGKEYPFRVCNAAMQPNLKYFVGFGAHTGGAKELFISADWPKELRQYVMLHEVKCVPNMDTPGHCHDAEESVFAHIPAPDKVRFADLRIESFTALIAYLRALKTPPEKLIGEMERTLAFLKSV